jgi:ribonucleoside-diphosphate reductase alpha chain/ribonucleoside-triphosphate reductase
MKKFNASLVSKYETEYLEREIDDPSCETGACPVR